MRACLRLYLVAIVLSALSVLAIGPPEGTPDGDMRIHDPSFHPLASDLGRAYSHLVDDEDDREHPRIDSDPNQHPLQSEIGRLERKADKLQRVVDMLEQERYTKMDERRAILEEARKRDHDMSFHLSSTCGRIQADTDKFSREVHDLKRKIQASEDKASKASQPTHGRVQHHRMAHLNHDRLTEVERKWQHAMVANEQCKRVLQQSEALNKRLYRLFDDAESPQAEGEM